MERKMTKFIGIASGKGGAGKTTVAINTALSISNFNRDITLLDANLSTPHISIHFGTPLLSTTIHEVLKGQKNLTEATYLHPSGLKVIPASISLEEIDELNSRKLSNLLFKHDFGELAIIDLPAGLSDDITQLFYILDELLQVPASAGGGIGSKLSTLQ